MPCWSTLLKPLVEHTPPADSRDLHPAVQPAWRAAGRARRQARDAQRAAAGLNGRRAAGAAVTPLPAAMSHCPRLAFLRGPLAENVLVFDLDCKFDLLRILQVGYTAIATPFARVRCAVARMAQKLAAAVRQAGWAGNQWFACCAGAAQSCGPGAGILWASTGGPWAADFAVWMANEHARNALVLAGCACNICRASPSRWHTRD